MVNLYAVSINNIKIISVKKSVGMHEMKNIINVISVKYFISFLEALKDEV